MDLLHLTGLRCYGYTGALPEEQILGQWFEVDLILGLDLGLAGSSDQLADTLDYRTLITQVQNTVATARPALLERLATIIAEQALADAQVHQVTVRLTKVSPPIPNFAGQITVELTRRRSSG